MRKNIRSAININIANNVNVDSENVRIVKIALFENDYQRLVSNGKRYRGSLRLTSDDSGDFLLHKTGTRPKQPTMIKTLPHGRVSVNDVKVHLHIDIDKQKEQLIPSMAIVDESLLAAQFVGEMTTIYN